MQWVGCLQCSMASINDLWDGSLDKRKVRSLLPYCGQDGYRAQVPQQPTDSYRYKLRSRFPCCGQDGYRAQVPQHPIHSYRYIQTYILWIFLLIPRNFKYFDISITIKA